jgi:lipoprotein-anchoring transpeptidase ErfK/SrfK
VAASESSSLRFSLTLVVVVVLAGAAGWALSHSSSPTATAPQTFQSFVPTRAPTHRGWSSLALARDGQLAVYRRRSAQTRMLVLSNPAVSSGRVTLLVKQQRGGWVQAYLPVRPNGLLGWVRRRAIRLVGDPWALAVQLRTHRLVVSHADRVIRVLPIAVGKPSTPTPTGTYFINELLKQPDPAGAYGPYAYGTSAYSDVLLHFNGGDGQIGIHGTNEPWVIGSSATHGCIRLYNRDIVWLSRRVPVGTPVQIRS